MTRNRTTASVRATRIKRGWQAKRQAPYGREERRCAACLSDDSGTPIRR